MAVGESPAVARHRLRRALRRAREAEGLTQGEVASALEWSLSKVNRIEAGEVSISRTDLQALLQVLGVTESSQVDELTAHARAARQRDWWDRPEYRKHLTRAMIQTLQFEANASVIRSFQPTVVPGVLQTRGYAETILDFWGSNLLSEADQAARLEIRLWRQEQLFSKPDPPCYLLLLDESVLWREVGGPQVMSEQLLHLHELARAERITLRVVPFASGSALASYGMFTIYATQDEDVLLYFEDYQRDEAVQAPEPIYRSRRHFEQAWQVSLDSETSLQLLKARAAAMRSTVGLPDSSG